jgi:hypothetical protein
LQEEKDKSTAQAEHELLKLWSAVQKEQEARTSNPEGTELAPMSISASHPMAEVTDSDGGGDREFENCAESLSVEISTQGERK